MKARSQRLLRHPATAALGLLLGGQALEFWAAWGLLNGLALGGLLAWLMLALALLAGAAASLWLQRSRRWAVALLGGLSLGLLISAGACAWALSTPWRQAPALQLERDATGRSLRLSGGMAPGSAQRLAQALAQHPPVLVELALSGGAAAEAQAMAEQLRASGLPLRLVGPCQRECLLLFLAGAQRQALPEGRLELQRLASPGLNPFWAHWLHQAQARRDRRAGLPEDWARLQTGTAAPHWQRFDTEQLRLAGLLSQQDFVHDTALPARALPAELEQALRTHGGWRALEQRFPGLLASTAAQMHAAQTEAEARQAPGTEAARRAADAQLQAHYAPLLSQAGLPLQLQYLPLLEALLEPLSESADCRALLAGDFSLRRRLPAPAVAREAEWMEAAARAGVAPEPLRPLSAREQEVLRRSMGDALHPLLPRLRPSSPRLDCSAARKLLRGVQELPLAQRRLALRQLFASPGKTS